MCVRQHQAGIVADVDDGKCAGPTGVAQQFAAFAMARGHW